MNRNVLGLNGIRVVADEDGNVRLFEVKDVDDNKNIDEIFELENDVEQLEDELVVKKKELKGKLSDFKFGLILELVIVGGAIFMLAVDVPLLVACLFVGVGGFIKGAGYGTILGNIKKRKKLKLVIEDTKLKLKEKEEELNKLKKNSSLKELEVYKKAEVNGVKYAFRFEPGQGINRTGGKYEQAIVSRGYALRLEKKSLNELLRDNK